jgi:hypothetical protein
MPKEHPRAGVTHNFFHSCPHLGLVAVDRALRARRLPGAERAAIQTRQCVIDQCLAFGTQATRGAMAVPTVDRDHGRDRLLLADKPLWGILLSDHCGHRSDGEPIAVSPILGCRQGHVLDLDQGDQNEPSDSAPLVVLKARQVLMSMVPGRPDHVASL